MTYEKLLVNEFFKEFEVLKVGENCFKNSPDDLKFKIQELKKGLRE